jgi:peptide/nickel transport system substrate-binding protein
MRSILRVPAVALSATLALGLAACGSSNNKSSGGGAGAGVVTKEIAGKKGGTLTVMNLSDVDSLDPGYAYYQFDYSAYTMPGHRSLYGWGPSDLAPRPDLATGDPVFSSDFKTATIKIRRGVKFSPPVNREVNTKDIKYALERGEIASVGNAYFQPYLGTLVGADAFKNKKASEITGIQTPDHQTLVLKFSTPYGGPGLLKNVLALPLSAPVPKAYAAKYDAGATSTYGQHSVFTGPYMIQNDGKGNITGYQPGKSITLVRNPNWDPKTDFRPAYVDKIVVDEGNDITVGSRRILNGQNLVSGDFAAPPTPILKQALATKKDQIAVEPSGSIRWVALNSHVKPLDNINVRKAIAAILDRDAMRLTRGGSTLGTVATHIIPPGLPGFDEAGGTGTDLDFLKSPTGNPTLAADYMKKAGYPSGKYTGNVKLLMVGDNQPPASKTGEAVQAAIEKLGFKLNYRQVTHPTMLAKFCGVPKNQPAICPNLGWGKDFFDSQSMLDPTFSGKAIVPVNNSNYGQLNDPVVNAAIDKAKALTDPAARATAWAAIDKMVTAKAVIIPWLWDNDIDLRSANVNGVATKFNSTWAYEWTSIK